MAAFVAFIPVLLLATSLVTEVGLRLWARTVAQAAADLAALAAVQEIDLDRLSRGERWIIENAAVTRARDVALDNVNRNLWVLSPGLVARVDVMVFNVETGEGLLHPRDGRRLRDPTVCVTVEVEAVALVLAPVGGRIEVAAHADAAVVEKE